MKSKKSFPLGQLIVTDSVHGRMCQSLTFHRFVYGCIGRHGRCDWGDADHHDNELNDYQHEHGGRLTSSYTLPSAVAIPGESRVWIITEADRSVTTVLFPSEY